MLLTHLSRTSFSGHESFPLRFGWLPKVALHLPTTPLLFTLDTAPTQLGVGKNMVYAIRHWSEAMGLIEPGEQKGTFHLTSLAQSLLSAEGWDPYLEDPGTLWLLHWQLMHHPERATLAHLLFTQYAAERFDKDQVLRWLERGLQGSPQVRATRSSLERDFDVLIRSYVPPTSTRGHYAEEAFDSPLVALGLLRRWERQGYEFVRGEQPGLPLEILAYAVMQFWQRTAPNLNTLSLERLMYDPGSPGAAFKLSESTFIQRLLALVGSATGALARVLGLNYDDTAGVRAVSRDGAWSAEDALRVLALYYSQPPLRALSNALVQA